jgi:hypothetical protein
MTETESTQVVTANVLETQLRRAGWSEEVIRLLFVSGAPHEVKCGSVKYIVKR